MMSYLWSVTAMVRDYVLYPTYVGAQYLAYPITAPIGYISQLMIAEPPGVSTETVRNLIKAVFTNDPIAAQSLLNDMTSEQRINLLTKPIELSDTLLHIVVRLQNSVHLASVLFKHMKDDEDRMTEVLSKKGSTGHCLFVDAAKHNGAQMLQLLLENIPPAYIVGRGGGVFIDIAKEAAQSGDADIILALAEYFINTDMSDGNDTILETLKVLMVRVWDSKLVCLLFSLLDEESQRSAVLELHQPSVDLPLVFGSTADCEVDRMLTMHPSPRRFMLSWAMSKSTEHVQAVVSKLPASEIKKQLLVILAKSTTTLNPSHAVIETLYPYSNQFILPNITSNTSRCSKHAMVLSYTFKDGNHPRRGAIEEANGINNALKSIGFNSEAKFDKPIMQELTTAVKDTKDDCAAFFLVIMSHGKKGKIEQPEIIHRDDGMKFLPVNLILEQLEHLPKFIPKVVIVQACQRSEEQIRQEIMFGGEDRDPAVFQQAEYVPTAKEHIELNNKLENTVLMMATSPGGYAMRNFFIESLAKQIKSADGKTDINAMFTKVSDEMTEHEHDEYRNQLPNYSGTLRKFLILPPANS